MSKFAPIIMAGIYVHIPFCKSRCVYCDFYSTTLLKWQDEYVSAVLKELNLRKDYLHGEPIETIYLGGGTPSQLNPEQLERLTEALLQHVEGRQGDYEFTVECNPDDVTPELASLLCRNGVNRVSMGAQTFSDRRLRFLHRRHTARQVIEAVNILREVGIRNVSIDLMFGFPDETLDDWLYDIHEAIRIHPQHISAYSLMYEEGTPLHRLLEEGRIKEIDEELSRRMYYTLLYELTAAGYEHYEISNFSLPDYSSRHNSSYWNGTHYLGLGAGAHSYDGNSRQWNASDLLLYINKVYAGEVPYEREQLDEVTKYNDMITTSLRIMPHRITSRESKYSTLYGNWNISPHLMDYMAEQAKPLIKKGLLEQRDGRLYLSREALYISDDVMSNLIMLE